MTLKWHTGHRDRQTLTASVNKQTSCGGEMQPLARVLGAASLTAYRARVRQVSPLSMKAFAAPISKTNIDTGQQNAQDKWQLTM